MRKFPSVLSITLIAAIAIAAAAALPGASIAARGVSAQVETQTPTVDPTTTPTQRVALPETGGDLQAQQQEWTLASNVVNRIAYLTDGTLLGRVESIIADGETGQIGYVVVELNDQVRGEMAAEFGEPSGDLLDDDGALQNGQDDQDDDDRAEAIADAGRYVPVPWQLVNVLELGRQPAVTGTPAAPGAGTALPDGQATPELNITPSGDDDDDNSIQLTPGGDDDDDANGDDDSALNGSDDDADDDDAQSTPEIELTGTPENGQEGGALSEGSIPTTGQIDDLSRASAIVIDTDLVTLNDAPGFSSNRIRAWSGMDDWGEGIAEHWTGEVAAIPQTGVEVDESNLAEFKDLNGIQVTNQSEEAVAHVEDMVIDPASGQIRFIIARTVIGDLTRMSSRVVAIPFDALDWEEAGYLPEFRISSDIETLDDAPEITSSRDLTELEEGSELEREITGFWSGDKDTEGGIIDETREATVTVTPTP